MTADPSHTWGTLVGLAGRWCRVCGISDQHARASLPCGRHPSGKVIDAKRWVHEDVPVIEEAPAVPQASQPGDLTPDDPIPLTPGLVS